MTLTLRGKVVLVALAVMVVATLTADAYLAPRLEAVLTSRFQAQISVAVALAGRVVEDSNLALDDFAGWDALADDLGERAGARLTVIRHDGVVLGDSEVALASLPGVENHATRPEVRDALRSERGVATRTSGTVHERMTYVAAAVPRVGVVRFAIPLTEVDRAIASVHRILAFGTLLALAVAAVLAGVAAQWVAGRTAWLLEAARRMAGGDLATRVGLAGRDEFARLGDALDVLARNLASTLGELRSERDLLGGILEGMTDGVLLLDGAGRIALVNPALRDMLMLDDVVGRTPAEVLRHPELSELFERARSTQRLASAEIELAGLKPRRLLVRVGAQPLLAVFVDVTDLRRLESMRRDFVANVSHELRTPVTAIRSAAETLRDSLAKDPAAGPLFLEMIERNAERLHLLVEDLLELSRLDARQYAFSLEALPIAGVLDHVLALCRERAARKKLRLLVEVGGHAVRADRRALEQVLGNLLDNAIKYCPEGAEIRVSARPVDDRIELVVADTGPGIEGSHLPRLFERFYRVDRGRSRDVGGTGLGLSIVKNLVEGMDGEVGVASTPGRGSAFRVLLPRAR